MRLEGLIANEATVEVPIDGAALHVTYRPAAFTPRLEAELRAGKSGEGSAALPVLLAKLLLSWDLELAGEPYPITEDALMDLPLSFLMAVSQGIAGDLVPNPTRAGS